MAWSAALRENFDKILVLMLLLFFFSLTIHMSHDSTDEKSVGWGKELTTGAFGALIGLVTGAARMKR